MYRALALRQLHSNITRAALAPQVRNIATTRVLQKSIIDSAKDTLSTLNKKTGEVLAGGMEKAEEAVPDVSVSEALNKANKKTGEVLADGMEKAEKIVPGSKKEAKDVAEDAKEKVQEYSEDAKEKVQEYSSKANKKTGEVLSDGLEKAEDAKERVEAKAKVVKNSSGYKDLQDKGKKVESEQNRPDDAV
ncbi:hypothetical protein CLIB1423_38S00166 [[Candida] railenensis]|uniref:Uncharacterized protein n=1 Tax=[Candida] railenensis TaxID=45579 RepID=A0A9P0W1C7_9ASCO|nr:hypothetical protein CLIB1423_38S00166 [[Candida] railenensis]